MCFETIRYRYEYVGRRWCHAARQQMCCTMVDNLDPFKYGHCYTGRLNHSSRSVVEWYAGRGWRSAQTLLCAEDLVFWKRQVRWGDRSEFLGSSRCATFVRRYAIAAIWGSLPARELLHSRPLASQASGVAHLLILYMHDPWTFKIKLYED